MAKVAEQRKTKLKEAREHRGLTQEEFAAHLGVSQQQLSRWETGNVAPSYEVIASIAEALDVSSDFILGLVDKPNEYRLGRPLKPVEIRLLWALEKGHIAIAFEALTALTKGSE